MARDLRRALQLQGFPSVPHLHVTILLGLFRCYGGLDLERASE